MEVRSSKIMNKMCYFIMIEYKDPDSRGIRNFSEEIWDSQQIIAGANQCKFIDK